MAQCHGPTAGDRGAQHHNLRTHEGGKQERRIPNPMETPWFDSLESLLLVLPCLEGTQLARKPRTHIHLGSPERAQKETQSKGRQAIRRGAILSTAESRAIGSERHKVERREGPRVQQGWVSHEARQRRGTSTCPNSTCRGHEGGRTEVARRVPSRKAARRSRPGRLRPKCDPIVTVKNLRSIEYGTVGGR